MSRQKSNPKTKRLTKELPSLKKLPSKKAGTKAASSKAKKKIVVDVRTRKNLSSVIELLKRKVSDAPKTKMPTELKPMLATLVDAPFNDGDWQFELKLDGYRTLAYINSGAVDLRSRNNNSFNKKFQPVHEALAQWDIKAVVDGEIVVLNDDRVEPFSASQFQPPSGSCSLKSRSMIRSISCPK